MPPCVEQVLFLALGSIENFCLKRLLYLKWTNSILVNRRLSFQSNCGTTREFSIWISRVFSGKKVLPDHFQFTFGFIYHFLKCHFHLVSRCSTSYEKSFRIGTETNLVNFYIHPVSYFSHFNFLLLFVFWAARQNYKYSSTKDFCCMCYLDKLLQQNCSTIHWWHLNVKYCQVHWNGKFLFSLRRKSVRKDSLVGSQGTSFMCSPHVDVLEHEEGKHNTFYMQNRSLAKIKSQKVSIKGKFDSTARPQNREEIIESL